MWTRVEVVGEDLAREETVTGLTNDQSYDFEVRAVNMQGEGAVATVTATLSAEADGAAQPERDAGRRRR